MVITYNFHFSRGVRNRKKEMTIALQYMTLFAVWVSIEIFRNGVIQAHNTGNWYFQVFIGAAKRGASNDTFCCHRVSDRKSNIALYS